MHPALVLAVGFTAGFALGAVLVMAAWAATDHARADLDSMDCPRPRDTSADGLVPPGDPEPAK